jgi:hypothetical protein
MTYPKIQDLADAKPEENRSSQHRPCNQADIEIAPSKKTVRGCAGHTVMRAGRLTTPNFFSAIINGAAYTISNSKALMGYPAQSDAHSNSRWDRTASSQAASEWKDL